MKALPKNPLVLPETRSACQPASAESHTLFIVESSEQQAGELTVEQITVRATRTGALLDEILSHHLARSEPRWGINE